MTHPDPDKDAIIDSIVLAALSLTVGINGQAWKGLNWDAMNRLYERGLLTSNPHSKAKSVSLSGEGMIIAETLLDYFRQVAQEYEMPPLPSRDPEERKGQVLRHHYSPWKALSLEERIRAVLSWRPATPFPITALQLAIRDLPNEPFDLLLPDRHLEAIQAMMEGGSLIGFGDLPCLSLATYAFSAVPIAPEVAERAAADGLRWAVHLVLVNHHQPHHVRFARLLATALLPFMDAGMFNDLTQAQIRNKAYPKVKK